MKTKKNKVSVKNSGYIDSSIYDDYLSDLELLTIQKAIEQKNEIEKLSETLKKLIDSKFNGNKSDAIDYYKAMCNIS
ncbi:hypothetical protein [Kordia sp.]|uniref:hypothetical protein n=1 Tax=Kordia sp. TaxID=1965332 RepID=UPI003D6BCF17